MNIRFTAVVAQILMVAACIYSLILFIIQSIYLSSFPFGMDYGEGIVWQQALSIFTSQAYGLINSFPAVVFHYTPIYHALVMSISTLFNCDVLLIGRLTSVFATLMIAILLGLISARCAPLRLSNKYKVVACVTTGLLIFSIFPILYWARLMRVDMLALLFTLTGFWLGLKSFDNTKWIYVSSLFFVLGVYTKQNTLIAPLALYSLMLWLNPRLAFKGICTCLLMGLVSLALMMKLTSGNFLKHIFLYNINIFDIKRISIAIDIIQGQSLLLLLTVFSITNKFTKLNLSFDELSLKNLRNLVVHNENTITFFAIFLYFIFSTLSLLLITKEGAAGNYTIEWFLTCILLVGILLLDTASIFQNIEEADSAVFTREKKIRVICIPLIIAVNVLIICQLVNPIEILKINASRTNDLTKLLDMAKKSNKPIISDEMALVLRSGKSVVWEPAIFAQLERSGIWDPRPLVTKIQEKGFGMFITDGDVGSSLFDSRYTPSIAKAIDDAYPIKEAVAGYIVHLPAQVSPEK